MTSSNPNPHRDGIEPEPAGATAPPSPPLSIQTIAAADLEPYANNPVEHDEYQTHHLKKSITAFGFKVPVIVGDDNTIVAGHARVAAVTELAGSDELREAIEARRAEDKPDIADTLELVDAGQVPVIDASDLTESEQAAFRIAENKTFDNSSWDRDALTFELREIDGAYGFSREELESILDTGRGTIDYHPGEVDDTRKLMESHYRELSEEKRDRKARVPCPHCDEWMYIDKPELERALNRAMDELAAAEGDDDDGAV